MRQPISRLHLNNKLIVEGTGEAIATMIGKRIVGMKFRPFSTSMMNNPAIEAGDICVISDRKGNTYRSLITSSTFQVGNKQNVECGAKSAARNSAKQYSLSSQTIAEYKKSEAEERKLLKILQIESVILPDYTLQ